MGNLSSKNLTRPLQLKKGEILLSRPSPRKEVPVSDRFAFAAILSEAAVRCGGQKDRRISRSQEPIGPAPLCVREIRADGDEEQILWPVLAQGIPPEGQAARRVRVENLPNKVSEKCFFGVWVINVEPSWNLPLAGCGLKHERL